MIGWRKRIVDAFISHYFAAVPKTGEDHSALRIRSSIFFPDFDTAHPDEKESYLEAAESLEREGLVQLRWEKRDKGERLKTLSCLNFEMLFEEAGIPYPKTEAGKTRAMLNAKVKALKETSLLEDGAASPMMGAAADKVISLLEFLSHNFGLREIGQGIDLQVMEEFVRLLEFLLEPARLEKITTRALSILLYCDSKRLENLLDLCAPLLSRAQKSVPSSDISFLERSYPEILISGKIIIEFNNKKLPMVNAGGHILGLPLESVEEITAIRLLSDKKEKTVLTIENKETFYALGTPQKYNAWPEGTYDCFLYTGGYSNRAAVALVKILAASDFSFYHAGDLDPDGILILQHIQDIAGKPVIPVRMDATTFDHYRVWARTLTKPMLRQVEKIREETKTIPGLAGLLRRIEETGLGVEQEIIDYR